MGKEELTQWLNRPQKISKEIEAAISAADEADRACTGITPNYNADVVSSSKDPQAKYDRYIEARENVNRLIDYIVDIKREMRTEIAKIPDRRCRKLLLYKYVGCQPWSVTARACKCTVSHAKQGLLKKSLKYLAKVVDSTHHM